MSMSINGDVYEQTTNCKRLRFFDVYTKSKLEISILSDFSQCYKKLYLNYISFAK